jgi:hypothetical protein
MIGLVVWLLVVLVAPGTTAVAAQSSVPLPERPHIRILWQEYSDGIKGTVNAPVVPYLRDLIPEEQEKLRLMQVHERKAEEQRHLFEVISRVSPAASYIYASTELAGTGLTYYDAFRRADERLADEYRAYVIEHRPAARANKLKAEDAEVGKLPSFAGASVGLRPALVAAGKDVAALLGETLSVLVVCMFLFVRTTEL